MLKKFFLLIFILALGTASWLSWRYYNNPPGIVPWPYQSPVSTIDWKVEAPVLFVGDRLMKRFFQYNTTFAYHLSFGLEKPIKSENWSNEGENIHRTLQKLRELKKWPPVIVYHGSSEEDIEPIYLSSEINKIKKNFSLFQNDEIKTLLMIYPLLARFIYHPIKRYIFLEKTPSEQKSKKVEQQNLLNHLSMVYLLYEEALKEMIQLVRQNNSRLILITAPINLDVKPKLNCPMTDSQEIQDALKEINQFDKQGDIKNAYSYGLALSDSVIGHSETFYTFGKIALKFNQRQKAVEALLKANAYDCSLWRGSEVFNSILRKQANKENIYLFDFSQLLTDQWPDAKPFFDEFYPQNLFYEQASETLGLQVRKILGL